MSDVPGITEALVSDAWPVDEMVVTPQLLAWDQVASTTVVVNGHRYEPVDWDARRGMLVLRKVR